MLHRITAKDFKGSADPLVIVVCGEALMDFVPIGDGRQRATPGGGPFNTARALGRLGVPTTFLGHLSTDTYGKQLADLLVADRVDLSLTSVGPEPTTLAIADVDADGLTSYRFVVEGTSAPNLTPSMLPPSLGPDDGALHVGSLGLVLEPMASTIVQLLQRERGQRLLMLDPNIRPVALTAADAYRSRLDAIIAQSTIVKASDEDLAWLYPELSLEAAMDRILASGVRLVVATLGAEGAWGASDDIRIRVPAPAVDVVDTIGAGDAFGAALLAWLQDHGTLRPDVSLDAEELRSALEFACLAASLTCSRAGAEPPWKTELSGSL